MTRFTSSIAAFDPPTRALPATARLEILPSQTKIVPKVRRDPKTGIPYTYEYPAYYVRLVAKNGNILMHSEGYTSRSGAIRAAQSMVNNAFSAPAMHCAIIEPNKTALWSTLYSGGVSNVKDFKPLDDDAPRFSAKRPRTKKSKVAP